MGFTQSGYIYMVSIPWDLQDNELTVTSMNCASIHRKIGTHITRVYAPLIGRLKQCLNELWITGRV